MPAYWLTHKPLGPNAPHGWPSDMLTALVERYNENPLATTEWWRIKNTSARPGDRVYLFKQGVGARGIFGVGSVVSGPEKRQKIEDGEELRWRAEIRFDALVDPKNDFLLRFDEISEIVPKKYVTAQASGTVLSEDVSAHLELRLGKLIAPLQQPIGSELSDDDGFDPDSVSDDRARALRSIRMRRGQAAFRGALLDAYERRCVMTECPIVDVLDAAHISPYRGSLTNHLTNGLLLRTDIHTLFDCDLIGINPETRRVVVAEALKGSSYSTLEGSKLRAPRNAAASPSGKCLNQRYAIFEQREAERKQASPVSRAATTLS